MVSIRLFVVKTALVVSVSGAPLATVLNGTYQGKYVPEWHQDHFLGIPYAQPPIGHLRFAWPQSLNESFQGLRDATKYGFSCYQYGSDFNLNEDCLTLNVVRPTGNANSSKLPVLVWIYGGGLSKGATADPQYNISGIAAVGPPIGKPILVVSMNYRLGAWGFLQSPQIIAAGSSNAGLLDQRLALRWIKENIGSFGGDPSRITIWGESAGAQSIAYHLQSYSGRDDGLFQAAIMESGSYKGAQVQPLAYYAAHLENLTRTTGCWTAKDQLACLRDVSSEALYRAQVTTIWNPLIDGDFLTGYPSTLFRKGQFIKIPLLIGANSDEGSSFSLNNINSETDLFNSLLWWRTYAISSPTARKLLELYPNDPANEPPYAINESTIFPAKGLQWRRSGAIGGDMVMISGRRKTCEVYAAAGLPVYSYRFDTPLWNAAITDGAKHFVNVAFSFQNISGQLGPSPKFESHRRLSQAIGLAYVNFVYDADPNPSPAGQNVNSSRLPSWPKYDLQNPVNMVLNSNRSFLEADTFRKEGIDFLNTLEVERELLS